MSLVSFVVDARATVLAGIALILCAGLSHPVAAQGDRLADAAKRQDCYGRESGAFRSTGLPAASVGVPRPAAGSARQPRTGLHQRESEQIEPTPPLRIDRPPMNALNEAVQEEIRAAAQEASERDDVRSVVVWGGEKVFAAGATAIDSCRLINEPIR